MSFVKPCGADRSLEVKSIRSLAEDLKQGFKPRDPSIITIKRLRMPEHCRRSMNMANFIYPALDLHRALFVVKMRIIIQMGIHQHKGRCGQINSPAGFQVKGMEFYRGSVPTSFPLHPLLYRYLACPSRNAGVECHRDQLQEPACRQGQFFA